MESGHLRPGSACEGQEGYAAVMCWSVEWKKKKKPPVYTSESWKLCGVSGTKKVMLIFCVIGPERINKMTPT